MSDKTRLDIYLQSKIPSISRAFAAKLIEQGRVEVNGLKVDKPGHKISESDKVKADYDPAQFKIPSIKLPILYEDDNCVVVNKPAGLLTHSKGSFNPEATVATWLRSHTNPNFHKITPVEDSLLNNRAGIVHRLDRGTSGVMICAKSPESLNWLQKQFSQRKVKKTYLAIISGQLEPAEAIIDLPIERNPKAPATFRVGAGGKPAKTHYKVIKSTPKYSLVELKPQTGRTHQLRVHLAYIKHPIVGDEIYGGQPADRLFLHAEKLELTLPSNERKTFRTELPAEFKIKMSER